MDPSILKIQSGTVIDQRFEILDVIGRGGFATVYKARQIDSERLIALKILGIRPGRAEKEVERFTERFFREALWAARIEHPNVVSVFDHGVTGGGIPYIAMELLEGRTLAEEIDNHGALDPQRALPLFLRCLDGLVAAHALGIVHKDIKPSNLFLHMAGDEGEDMKILDFGIAALEDADRDERLTATDQFIGTASYCAPEYYKEKLVSPALDIYQMGLVLAEAFMGERVVDTSDVVQAIAHHCKGALRIPFALTSSPLGEVLKRALALNPEDRYASAEAFQDALASLKPQSIPSLTDDDLQARVPLFPEGQRPLTGDLKSADILLDSFGTAHTDTLSPPTLALAPSAKPTPLPKAPQPEPISTPQEKRRTPPWAVLAILGLVVIGLVIWQVASPPAPEKAPEKLEAAPKTPTEAKKTPEKASAQPSKTPTPEKKAPAPVAEAAPTSTKLSLKLKPDPPTGSTFELLGSARPPMAIQAGQITLDSTTHPMPWALRITSPRRQDTLLRIEHTPQAPDTLSVQRGRKDKAGDAVWSDPRLHKADKPGRFTIEAELGRPTPPSGQKRTFKKEWVIE